LLDENDLAPQEAPATPVKKPSTTLLVAAAVAVLLAVVAGFATWGRLHGANAAVTKNVPTAILRLAGSNTIGDTLGPSLAEAFLKDQGATDVRILPGANPLEKIVEGVLPGDSTASSITIAAHGSATAFTALAGNNCDIGMASRKIKPEEAAKLTSLGDMASIASEHVLGLDGIAVIVNATNPSDKLDKEKIMRIFTGEITDWSQVGSLSGAIKIYARNDNSGTYDTFKSLVLAGKPLAPGAQRIEDSKALSDAVAADPNGIGFIGLPYIQSAKPIAVSDKGTLSLLPTRLTVSTEDYLLSRRLYLYTPANPSSSLCRRKGRMLLEPAVSLPRM
jgi:phosphate transport system substrate-binding protein